MESQMAEGARASAREAHAKRQLLRIMALFIIGGGGLFTVVTLALWVWGSGSLLDPLGAGGLAMIGVLVLLLNRRGQQRVASGILVGLLMIVPTYYILLEGPRNTGLLLMVGAVVYSDFLLGGRSGLAVAVIEGLLYVSAGLVYEQGWLQGLAYVSPLVADVVTVAMVCFALALSAGFFTREMKRALQNARQQEQALRTAEVEKERLFAEVRDREEEQRRLLERVQELGSPIIPLGHGVVAMPIIGVVDGRRAVEVTGELLRGVEKHRARVAIVDITGVPIVNAVFGMMLLQMAQGLQLLGAEPVLTGVGPAVAEALVDTGLDFSAVTPQATLQEGLDYALQQQRVEKVNGMANA
jgi:anti-anti-sigma regulatory factor